MFKVFSGSLTLTCFLLHGVNYPDNLCLPYTTPCNMLPATTDVLQLHFFIVLRDNSNSRISMVANLLVFSNTPAAANRITLFGVINSSYDINTDINVIRRKLIYINLCPI